jgi:molybdenum cofactor synthesis domain-containing protein
MKEISVYDAVGMTLAHDLTKIVPGEFKGRIFKKGHIIRAEDIPQLLDIGKQHLYVEEPDEGKLHEDDAAIRLARAVMGNGLSYSEPCEGKVKLLSQIHGLLKIETHSLYKMNSIGELVVVTKRTNQIVQIGEVVASLKAIPLMIDEQKIVQFERIAVEAKSVISVVPFCPMKVGIVTTGSEIASGRIEDRFGPRIREKLLPFPTTVLGQKIVGDKKEDIQNAIREFISQGADIVICTGGMSVDPDDRTPGAIGELATTVVSYGIPVFPGSMMMLAYMNNVCVFGLPGAVIYEKRTAFDLFLPRILAGDPVTFEEVAELGHGGLL